MSTNPKSVNYRPGQGKADTQDNAAGNAAINAKATTDAVAANSGDSGRSQSDKAKAAVVKGA